MDNETAYQTPAPKAAPDPEPTTAPEVPSEPMKFCKHCGKKISEAAVICPFCGCQVEEFRQATQTQPNIVINNANNNTNKNTNVNGAYVYGKPKNKWVAVLLCLFLGGIGAHKFYEGKIGMGILYIFTLGLLGIGCVVDFIRLLLKPNPYFV